MLQKLQSCGMKFISILSALLIAFEVPPAMAASPPAMAPGIEKKAPCRLEVDNAHISSNILKHENRHAVKVIFRSICNMDQNQLEIKLQIKKNGLFIDHGVTPVLTKRYSFVSALHTILIQDVYVYCRNAQRTLYYGTARAQATIHGKIVTAPRVESKKRVPLACGT